MNKELILEKARDWLSQEQEGLELKTNQDFLDWIEFSSLHKSIFEEEKTFRESITNLSAKYKNEKIKEVKDELQEKKFFSKVNILLPIAACFVLLVFSYLYTGTAYTYTQAIHSQNKIIHNIQMPDNSLISLDAKTNIKVLYSKNKREVILKKGTAVFQVSPNKNRPFYVRSDAILVKVLGTKFEVSKEEEKTKISVLEGVVAIRQGVKDKTRILARLEKGDILYTSDSGKDKTLTKNNANEIALWRDEKLIFKQTDLKDVIQQFSKYTKFDIHLNIIGKDTYPITGEFGVYEFDKFLDFLPLVYPIKIDKIKENQVILKNNT